MILLGMEVTKHFSPLHENEAKLHIISIDCFEKYWFSLKTNVVIENFYFGGKFQ